MSVTTAKVYTDSEGQHLTLPPHFHLDAEEVYLRRDPGTGDLIVARKPTWEEVLLLLKEADFPEDFLADRGSDIPEKRDWT